MEKKIKEVMSTQIEMVKPDSTIEEAARKMADLDIGAIPVCDGEKLRGIITDRDITARVVARGKDPHTISVKEVMSTPIIYCFEDEDVGDVAHIMETKQIRRIVVLNHEKKLVGIASLSSHLSQRAPDFRKPGLIKRSGYKDRRE